MDLKEKMSVRVWGPGVYTCVVLNDTIYELSKLRPRALFSVESATGDCQIELKKEKREDLRGTHQISEVLVFTNSAYHSQTCCITTVSQILYIFRIRYVS